MAVLCQAIQELASDIRGQMLADQIRAAVAERNGALRARSALAYSMVLAVSYEPLAALLRQLDNRAAARQQFHDSLLANVLTRQLWYQAGMWTSPAWEMFNQYAKYLALGASTAEVDELIRQLSAAGLPVPGEVGPGRWLSYAEELQAKPNVDVDDIRGACAQAVTAATYLPTYGAGGPARMPNGNCFEFTANSQPGNRYRRAAGGSCFTGDTQVLNGSGQPVPLRQLRRGDTVLTRAGTGTVAYVGQPSRGARAVYQVNGGGPVFTATHPFFNGAPPDPGAADPVLSAISPQALALSVPTLSEDGIAALAAGSQLLSRAPGQPAPVAPVTVTTVAEVPPGPDDGYLYDVHLEPGDGGRQEFWLAMASRSTWWHPSTRSSPRPARPRLPSSP